jgi:hypothetical protein
MSKLDQNGRGGQRSPLDDPWPEINEEARMVHCVLSIQDDKNGYDVQWPAESTAWAHHSNVGVSLVIAPYDDSSGGFNAYAVAKLSAVAARRLAARLIEAADKFDDPTCGPYPLCWYGTDLLAPIYPGTEPIYPGDH